MNAKRYDRDIDSLKELYSDYFGVATQSVSPLPAAGGDRRYLRLESDKGTALGVVADSIADSKAFVALTEVFVRNGINVPKVYAYSPDYRYYLVQDLGDISLFSILGSDSAPGFVAKVMKQLAKMQTIPAAEWKNAVAYTPFSRRQVMWDLNYFKYEYLKNCGVAFDEERLEDDFEKLAEALLALPASLSGFMMRDCQSRNVMICNETPWFIDYQGGRRGPCIYDAVSFLWQARAGFSEDFRQSLLSVYAGEFGKLRGIDAAEVLRHVPQVVLFRTLQVLGAYGFRGLVQKRAHFIESIPAALRNLESLVAEGVLKNYPALEAICREIVKDERFTKLQTDGKLHIYIFSFSYKRGYPEDFSGNGGGFMFDCRGMHNPGRYDEYKRLTGMDQPVIDFLRERGEADIFAAKAFEMVSPAIECYLRRGFSSLQIGFGCTGGRHRSVYCAEAVARTVAERYPNAVIHLCHREQNISRIL